MVRSPGRGETLTEELFDKQSDLAVDFEITLAALIGTASLHFLHPTVPVLSQISAFGVLSVTFIRRLAQVSTNAERGRIRDRTTPFLELFSVLAILTLISTMAYSASSFASIFSPLGWFVIGSFLLFVLTVVIEEKLFADYTIWWFAKFEEKMNETGSLFYLVVCTITSRISYSLGSRSKRELFKTGMSTHIDRGFSEMDTRKVIESIGKMLVLGLFAFGVFMLMGWYYFGLIGILAVIPALLARDHIRFWYLAYGDTTFEKLTDSLRRSFLTLSIYMGAVISLHGNLLAPLPIV